MQSYEKMGKGKVNLHPCGFMMASPSSSLLYVLLTGKGDRQDAWLVAFAPFQSLDETDDRPPYKFPQRFTLCLAGIFIVL
jgi:hypothetical protein